MAERAEIENLVKAVYAARMRGDLDGVMRHFSDQARFSLAGSPAASPVPTSASGHAAVREVLRRLIASFDFSEARIVAMVVEGQRAAVHSSVRVRATATGQVAVTEIVDLIQFDGDRIASFHQFADTALAARLLSS